jgi:hypothetical protein
MTTPKSPKGWHSRGYLPHFDTPERPQHVLFRTAGPLPEALSDCADPLERARRLDAWLDGGKSGSPLAQASPHFSTHGKHSGSDLVIPEQILEALHERA